MSIKWRKFPSVILKFFLIGLFAALNTPALAQNFTELAGLNPSTKYQTVETQNFKITYAEGLEKFTEIAAPLLEDAHATLSPIFKWKPRKKIQVLVIDNEDSANGFALPALRVGVVLNATPPEPWFSTSFSEDWIRLLVFHEYAHVLNIDPTTSWMEALRWWYGDAVRPNGLWTSWMLEGLATYIETAVTQQGRGKSSYWAGLTRALVNEGRLGRAGEFDLAKVSGEYPYFPGGESAYYFGYQVWNELFYQENQGPELAGEYSIRSSSRVPYFLNGNLENLTQKDWDHYWNSMASRLQDQAQKEIETIKQNEVTYHEPITQARYSALGGMISPNGEWLAWTEVSPEKRQGLWVQRLKNAQKIWIDDKLLGVGLTFTQHSDWLIYSSLTRQKTFLAYSDLYAYELETGRIIRLTHGLRAKDPHVSPDGSKIIFTQSIPTGNTISIANLIFDSNGDPKLTDISELHKPQDFSILGTPRFLPDSRRVVFSVQKRGQLYSDIVLMPVNGSPVVETLVHAFGFSRYPFPHEDKIYFSSDITGVENIYELDLVTKKQKAVTNIISSAQLPFVSPNGIVHASLLTANGFEVVRFPQMEETGGSHANPPKVQHSLVAPKSIEKPKPENSGASTNTIIHGPEKYNPWPTLWPRQWAPIAGFQTSSVTGTEVFGNVLGFDSTGVHQYFASLSYQTLPKTFDPYLQYSYFAFLPQIVFTAQQWSDDIKALTVANAYARRSEALLSLRYPIQWTFSSLTPEIYAFFNWNRAKDITTGASAPVNDYEFTQGRIPGFGTRLVFNSLEQSKLGVVSEGGVEARALAEARYDESVRPIYKYLFSFASYHELFEHAVLRPRVRWVGTTRTTQSTSSSVFVESGTQSTLDKLGIRGYPFSVFRTRGAGAFGLDFTIPVAELFTGITSIGTFPLFARQFYLNLFAETGYIPTARIGNLYLPSVGGSLNLTFTAFYRAPITISLEYEQGLRKKWGGDQVINLGVRIPELW